MLFLIHRDDRSARRLLRASLVYLHVLDGTAADGGRVTIREMQALRTGRLSDQSKT